MSSITIQGTDHRYDESHVITFTEGLIGFPQIRQAVVIEMVDVKPFCWLAPINGEEPRFVVVEPQAIFEGYQPHLYQRTDGDADRTYAIVTVDADWKKTTVNLRAPIIVDPITRIASQQILSDSPYQLAEMLPRV